MLSKVSLEHPVPFSRKRSKNVSKTMTSHHGVCLNIKHIPLPPIALYFFSLFCLHTTLLQQKNYLRYRADIIHAKSKNNSFFIILVFPILFCMHFTLKVCLVKRIKGGGQCTPISLPPPFLLYREEEQETAVHVLRRNEHETYRIQTREFSQPISGDKSPCHLHTTL